MKQSAKFNRTEILIVLAIGLIVLRFVFAGVLGSYERRFFAALGIGDGVRLLLLAPLAAGVFYLSYRRGKYSGRVPSWLMILGICVVVLLAGSIAWWLSS